MPRVYRSPKKLGSDSNQERSSAKSLPVPTEHTEQAAFVMWFRTRFKGVMIFAIPNGEARSIVVAKRLKAEGVTPGVLDLFIPAWRLWVEMKRTKGGRLSDEQKDFIQYVEMCGYQTIVAKGAKDASERVVEFAKCRESGSFEVGGD